MSVLRSMLTRLARFSPTANVGLVLLALAVGPGLTGCGSEQIAQAQTAIEAARDVAAVAEPCLVASMNVELERCEGDIECKDAVMQSYRPMADALDLLHNAWCAISPDSEGCEK